VVWYTDVKPFEVSASQYDLYQKFFLDRYCYTNEEIERFSSLNNPDFNYDALIKLINSYSLEDRLLARYREGLITENELKSAGISF
jgi:hypothetical protein